MCFQNLMKTWSCRHQSCKSAKYPNFMFIEIDEDQNFLKDNFYRLSLFHINSHVDHRNLADHMVYCAFSWIGTITLTALLSMRQFGVHAGAHQQQAVNWTSYIAECSMTDPMIACLKVIEIFMQDVRFTQQCFWGFRSSGVTHRALGLVVPDVLRDHIAFVFSVFLDCLTLEGEDTLILWNIRNLSPIDTASHTRTHEFCNIHY